MKQRWLVLLLLLGGVMALLAGCNTRATSTPQVGAPAGPPAPTAGAVQPTAVPAPVSPQPPAGAASPTVAPTPAPLPPAMASPKFTVRGTLESGVPWGTTSDGNYFKGDPAAPLVLFEFSDFQ